MDFDGKLGKYKIIETLDQTKTLWSEYFNEAFHNLFGAYEETLYNYISGCHIEDQLKSNQSVHVLDVGFGLGIGLKAFIDEIKKHKTKIDHSYTSMNWMKTCFYGRSKRHSPIINLLKKVTLILARLLTFPSLFILATVEKLCLKPFVKTSYQNSRPFFRMHFLQNKTPSCGLLNGLMI